jgi:spore germination protein KA
MNFDIKKNINLICNKFGNSSDLKYRYIKIGKNNIAYIFIDTVCSDDKISDFVLKKITNIKSNCNLFEFLKNNLSNSNIKEVDNYDDIYNLLVSGFLCLFIDGNNKAIAIETRANLDRSISEATSETVIRGPKDSFTENHLTNIGLIRKRIKDTNLWFTDLNIGKRTNTKVSVAYIKDIANTNNVRKITNKLKKINIDGIIDSGYIREYLNTSKFSIFPQMISTERPDLVSQSLLNGKIVILVENSPYALIIPGLFVDYFHSPEDYYQKNINANFTRIIRFISFIITMLTPALYISVTSFNPEILPKELMNSIIMQRKNVPFPPYIEILLLTLVFEILRESDIRIPNAMGTAVSVVGGLVLGNAAVEAGIFSAISIIIVAITSICGLLFSDIDMVNSIRIWRIFFIIGASFLGLVGTVLIGLILTINLSSTEVLGIPYLLPISPFNINDNSDAIIKLSIQKRKQRPSYLAKKNIIRESDNIE